jgi:hypothetical protein
LIAVYVRDVLHANSVLFGALGSAIGAGMLAGGFAVTPAGPPHPPEGAPDHRRNPAVRRLHRRHRPMPNSVAALAGCFGIGVGASLLTIAAMTLCKGRFPPKCAGA